MIPMQKSQFHPNKGLDTATAFIGSGAVGTWRCYGGRVVQPGLHDWFWPDLGDVVRHRNEVVEGARFSKLVDNNRLSRKELNPSN